MTLDEFNTLDAHEASQALQLCCVSKQWINGVLLQRPYKDLASLRRTANSVWSNLAREDYLEAFEGHPKIGDVNSLKAKYANSGDLAAHEQSGVAQASQSLIERLASGNQRYEERFGYIFIVCATGKSALEMCELLEQRLKNDPETELQIAAEEQRKILQIRLEQWQ
ncbi:2-oxo-4-hydroxy-4-carboxy-5-ureidoimidazoline decarboxylase [Congregibacter variabilis]|uniref:2-oxo-4-hydroxy-4-carboxy-5-ureidoimidazoline decarboxylase n=1 Tax=Congregibacter variabilis TaxID=3081200 RepID=A0ABZ0I3J9_9GAMM|nr:2-oxo-4-hydroxy-4-carboxy-5-ureidoimidazoline decarboxylase [Congregibacter sp. IMCC43200]